MKGLRKSSRKTTVCSSVYGKVKMRLRKWYFPPPNKTKQNKTKKTKKTKQKVSYKPQGSEFTDEEETEVPERPLWLTSIPVGECRNSCWPRPVFGSSRRARRFHMDFFFFLMLEKPVRRKKQAKFFPPLLLISFSVAQCIESKAWFPPCTMASGHDLDGKFK